MSVVVGAVQQIEDNWRTGQCKMQRIQCRSEASKGVYCLQYDDQKIVSGLRDNTIKVTFQLDSLWVCCKTPQSAPYVSDMTWVKFPVCSKIVVAHALIW